MEKFNVKNFRNGIDYHHFVKKMVGINSYFYIESK